VTFELAVEEIAKITDDEIMYSFWLVSNVQSLFLSTLIFVWQVKIPPLH